MRIVQAVPLTAGGVDALGRPFQERASTLIINCHGCRYQSKHYVLKNMWITLEVPHPEPGREPRVTRGRVMWIQRPRTIRELFQVGVELETPGNLWGIAFAPPDWFPFPEGAPGQIPSEMPATIGGEGPFESAEPLEEEWMGAPRPLPSATEASLARQMTHLVNEAKQQLHTAISEGAARAVPAEAQPLIAALQNQVKDAAERSVDAAAGPAAEQAVRSTLAQAEQANEARIQTRREQWSRVLDEGVAQASKELAEHLETIAEEHGAAFEHQLAMRAQRAMPSAENAADLFSSKLKEAQEKEVQENVALLDKQAGESTSAVLDEIEQRIQAKVDQARGQIGELDQAAQQLHGRIEAITAAAQSAWQARLDADLAVATDCWSRQVEISLESAARQAAERLASHSQESTQRLESEIGERVTAMRTAFGESIAAAENSLVETLRASVTHEAAHAQEVLTQVQSATRGMEEWGSQLAGLAQTAQEDLQRRATGLVEAQSQELARRAEESIAAWSERLQPEFEAAGQQTVARLAAELEQQLRSRLDHASQAVGDLERRVLATEDRVRSHQEDLVKVSERVIEAGLGRLQESIARLEHEGGESARAAVAKWLAEIDAKAAETTHTTFESLFKIADWYEKKVQTQMQTTLEKALEQASSSYGKKRERFLVCSRQSSITLAAIMSGTRRARSRKPHGKHSSAPASRPPRWAPQPPQHWHGKCTAKPNPHSGNCKASRVPCWGSFRRKWTRELPRSARGSKRTASSFPANFARNCPGRLNKF